MKRKFRLCFVSIKLDIIVYFSAINTGEQIVVTEYFFCSRLVPVSFGGALVSPGAGGGGQAVPSSGAVGVMAVTTGLWRV